MTKEKIKKILACYRKAGRDSTKAEKKGLRINERIDNLLCDGKKVPDRLYFSLDLAIKRHNKLLYKEAMWLWKLPDDVYNKLRDSNRV